MMMAFCTLGSTSSNMSRCTLQSSCSWIFPLLTLPSMIWLNAEEFPICQITYCWCVTTTTHNMHPVEIVGGAPGYTCHLKSHCSFEGNHHCQTSHNAHLR